MRAPDAGKLLRLPWAVPPASIDPAQAPLAPPSLGGSGVPSFSGPQRRVAEYNTRPWSADSPRVRVHSMTAHTNTKPGAIAVFGWGVVAPGARDMAEFASLLERGEAALEPARGLSLGEGLFPVGDPRFDFEDYRPWIASRFGEARYTQLAQKMGDNALFAVGALIQALGGGPSLETALRDLDEACHVYVGSGVGDLPQSYAAHAQLERATRRWARFWASPERCAPRRAHVETGALPPGEPPPPDPATLEVDSDERFEAGARWDAYWAVRSEQLTDFCARYREIERRPAAGPEEHAPLHAIRARERAHRKLVEATGCPTPPWLAVDPKLVWAIQNVPAAQISMLLGTHGPAWAPVGACSTFGVALKCGLDAIQRGEAKAAVIGTTDPRPDPALVAAFHRTHLAPATGDVNFPLTALFGTHVAGGSCVWVIADVAAMAARGIRPIGPVIEAATISSDAEHIITPSATGPKRAIDRALALAHVAPDEIAAWDLHATGTPGDLSELKLISGYLGPRTALTALKGLFGHGMANGGGWELTALALTLATGRTPATGIGNEALHPSVRAGHGSAVVTTARVVDGRAAVKLTLGIGGITACVVLSRAAGNT